MKPNAIQIIVVVSIAILTFLGMATMCLCAFFKIYIEPTLMISLNGLTFGLGGSLTTILVGRTVSQLAQPGDGETTITQTTQSVTKPKASTDLPLVVTKQPEVAVVNQPPIEKEP